MSYNPTYKRDRSGIKLSRILPVLLLFAVIIGASFYAGVLWQKMQSGSENIELASSGETSKSTAKDNSKSTGKKDSSLPGKKDEENTDSSEESSSESEPEPEVFEPLVEKTEFADLSYFDDAVFIGDSVTSGLSGYGFFTENQVLADTSINFESILYRAPFTDLNGAPAGTLDAVKCRNPKKIYIMLGANGIEWITLEKLMSYYDTLLTDLQDLMPDAVIYVQTCTPVTYSLDTAADRDLTNEKINAYNEALYDLAREHEVYYLAVNEVFKDENGYLPDEASPFDGLHFTKNYYGIWVEYLRNHALFQTPSNVSLPAGSEVEG